MSALLFAFLTSTFSIAQDQQNPYCDKADHCISVVVASFQKEDGKLYFSQKKSDEFEREVNKIWSPCRIGFKFEPVVPIVPKDFEIDLPLSRAEPLSIDVFGNISLLFEKYYVQDQISLIATSDWVGKMRYYKGRNPKTGDQMYRSKYETAGITRFENDPEHKKAIIYVRANGGINAITIAHELGHVLGLDDTKRGRALMSYYDPANRNLSDQECSDAQMRVKGWVKL